jgi:membrane associated rhomboid family serine protease
MPIRITPAVKVLLIAIFAMFIIQNTADQFMGGNILGTFGLVPSGFVIDLKFWQLFTYAFLHGDVMHLFLNLMMLVFIGGELEAVWGTRRFVTYFFFCSVMAGIFYLFLQLFVWREGLLHTPMVGASAGIYGLLMAYGLIFGERVLLFMLLFPMKAKHFIWILAAIEFMSTVFGPRGGIASAAHLGGMVAGFGYLYAKASWIIAQRRRAEGQSVFGGPKRKKRAKHLKLVISNKGSGDGDDEDSDNSPKTGQ